MQKDGVKAKPETRDSKGSSARKGALHSKELSEREKVLSAWLDCAALQFNEFTGSEREPGHERSQISKGSSSSYVSKNGVFYLVRKVQSMNLIREESLGILPRVSARGSFLMANWIRLRISPKRNGTQLFENEKMEA